MDLTLFLLVGASYFILIAAFTVGIFRLKPTKEANLKKPFISVLIPFKDEVVNLPKLIDDLSHQTYTNYEVILIADHVAEGWLNLLHTLVKKHQNIQIVNSPNVGKKGALKYGLTYAKGELITYTDADCRVNTKWLETINNHFDHKTDLLIGSVILSPTKTLFQQIQALEMQSLMASTAGSCAINHPIMSSGANLTIRKTIYSQLSEAYIKEDVSSGDDMFLLMALKKQHKNGIKFMRDTNGIVSTTPEKNLKSFVKQRMRWTSKSGSYRDAAIIASAIIVLLTNTLAIAGFFINAKMAFLFVVGKIIIDFPILFFTAKWFKGQQNLSVYLITEIIYPFYVTISVLGGMLLPLKWKGEKVRR